MHSDELQMYRARAREVVPQHLLAPEDLPAGFETLWGFLYRTEPHVLLDLQPTLETLAPEAEKARRLARVYREPFVEIDTGEGMIGAYTRVVLHETFPAGG